MYIIINIVKAGTVFEQRRNNISYHLYLTLKSWIIFLRRLKLNHLNIGSTLKYLQIAIYSLLSNIFFLAFISWKNTFKMFASRNWPIKSSYSRLLFCIHSTLCSMSENFRNSMRKRENWMFTFTKFYHFRWNKETCELKLLVLLQIFRIIIRWRESVLLLKYPLNNSSIITCLMTYLTQKLIEKMLLHNVIVKNSCEHRPQHTPPFSKLRRNRICICKCTL